MCAWLYARGQGALIALLATIFIATHGCCCCLTTLLQSQLRTQLLQQLRKLAGPDAVRAAEAGQDQARSMWHAALDCLLAEYLEASGCQFTLSVFKSESDMPDQPTFSAEELCQLLRLDRQPQLLQRVQELLPAQGVPGCKTCPAPTRIAALQCTAHSCSRSTST